MRDKWITTAQIGLTTEERQNQVEKKGKVLPSDNNSPNRTDYPRETEPGEKRERFCLEITTAQTELTTHERQNQMEKKGEVLPSDNNNSHTNDKTGKKI